MTGSPPPPDTRDLLDQVGFLHRLALSLVRDSHRAEDLAQDTLVAALERPPARAAALRSWLSRVLRRRVAEIRRGERRREARERGAAAAAELPSTTQVAARQELLADLLAAVQGLPEPYRSTIHHRYLEERPPREIARRLGIPLETVKWRLKKGLAKLRVALDRKYPENRSGWLAGLAAFAGKPRQGVAAGAWMTSMGGLLVALKTKVLLGTATALLLAGMVLLVLPPAEATGAPGEGRDSVAGAPSPGAGGQERAGEERGAPRRQPVPVRAGVERDRPGPGGTDFLTGRVVDSRDRGLEGIEVRLCRGRMPAPLRLGHLLGRIGRCRGRFNLALPGESEACGQGYLHLLREGLALEEVALVRTGEGGGYRFDRLTLPGPGSYLLLVVLARWPYMMPLPIPLSPARLGPGKGPRTVLRIPTEIWGELVPPPGPGQSAQVYAWRLGEGREAVELRSRNLDRDGTFTLEGLHPGRWRTAARIQGGGFLLAWGPAVSLGRGGSERVTIRAGRDGELRVDLLSRDRLPLPYPCQVHLYLRGAGPPGSPEAQKDLLLFLRRDRVLSGREYRLDGLAPGRYLVTVHHADCFHPVFTANALVDHLPPGMTGKEVHFPGGRARAEVLLPAQAGPGRLEVTVVDRRDRPQEGVVVNLISGRRGLRSTRTDAGGRAAFPGMAPLEYAITLGGRYHRRERVPEPVDFGTLPGGVRRRVFRLPCTRSVAGQVVDPAGRGVGGLLVHTRLLTPDGTMAGATRHTRTDKKGRFTLTRMEPGPFLIAAAREDRKVERRIDLAPDRQEPIVLVLP